MITELWNLLLFRPFLNALLLLYSVLGHNFALSIVALTVLLRLATQPLLSSSLKASKRMGELQPQLKELEKKYGKDRQRLQQEQAKLYKEHGINPLAGCLPMLLQLPIMMAFYQAIVQILGRSPLQLLGLSKHIYNLGIFSHLQSLLPLASRFLWLDLGLPDPYFVLPILTGVTMWLSQKMMTPPTPAGQENAAQASMGRTMQLWMPIFFGWITLNLASGLALYIVVSNVIGMIVQYFMTGWGGLLPQRAAVAAQPAAPVQKGTKSGSRKKKR